MMMVVGLWGHGMGQMMGGGAEGEGGCPATCSAAPTHCPVGSGGTGGGHYSYPHPTEQDSEACEGEQLAQGHNTGNRRSGWRCCSGSSWGPARAHGTLRMHTGQDGSGTRLPLDSFLGARWAAAISGLNFTISPGVPVTGLGGGVQGEVLDDNLTEASVTLL